MPLLGILFTAAQYEDIEVQVSEPAILKLADLYF